ncbi:PilZ domain-containing protein [bacterium]|nr:MAG: PilZ domain-containing protein [bacterium]
MEKRAYQRIPVSFEADILSTYRDSATFIGNLSPHGLYLIAAHMVGDKDLACTSEIDLYFKTHTGEKLNLHCKRRWSYAITPNSLINRIGMEIIDPPEKYKEFLNILNSF